MKKILLTIGLLATINLPAQSPHPTHTRIVTHTNLTWHTDASGGNPIVLEHTTQEVIIETEPCVIYHYYGLRHSGGVSELGQFADHDPILNQWENGDFGPDFRCILRSESPATKLVIIRQNLEPQPVARFPPYYHPTPFIPPNPPLPILQTNNITSVTRN